MCDNSEQECGLIAGLLRDDESAFFEVEKVADKPFIVRTNYAVIDQSLSAGYWDYMFKIPMNGLNRDKYYRVAIGGVAKGTYTGTSLLKDGFRISLDGEYRACVVEFDQH